MHKDIDMRVQKSSLSVLSLASKDRKDFHLNSIELQVLNFSVGSFLFPEQLKGWMALVSILQFPLRLLTSLFVIACLSVFYKVQFFLNENKI